MQELPFVPVIYLIKLVELMEEENLRVDYVLRECGINPSLLARPEVYLTVHQSRTVIQKFLGLTSLPHPGVRLGLRLDLLTHGLFGYVFLFRGHFRDLIDDILGYMKVRLPLLQLGIRHEPDYFAITIEFPIKFPEVESFMIQTYLSSFYKLGSLVSRNVSIHTREALFDCSRSLQALLPVPISTGHTTNEIRFYVNESQPASDRAKPVTGGGDEVMDLPDIVVRLRQFILSHASEALSAEDAASHLGMSVRTLRRRLSEGGDNYQQIRLDVRMNTALRYLQTSNISIERIANLVGYSDQATFSRAFLKWHGETPDTARKKTLKQYLKGDGNEPAKD